MEESNLSDESENNLDKNFKLAGAAKKLKFFEESVTKAAPKADIPEELYKYISPEKSVLYEIRDILLRIEKLLEDKL